MGDVGAMGQALASAFMGWSQGQQEQRDQNQVIEQQGFENQLRSQGQAFEQTHATRQLQQDQSQFETEVKQRNVQFDRAQRMQEYLAQYGSYGEQTGRMKTVADMAINNLDAFMRKELFPFQRWVAQVEASYALPEAQSRLTMTNLAAIGQGIQNTRDHIASNVDYYSAPWQVGQAENAFRLGQMERVAKDIANGMAYKMYQHLDTQIWLDFKSTLSQIGMTNKQIEALEEDVRQSRGLYPLRQQQAEADIEATYAQTDESRARAAGMRAETDILQRGWPMDKEVRKTAIQTARVELAAGYAELKNLRENADPDAQEREDELIDNHVGWLVRLQELIARGAMATDDPRAVRSGAPNVDASIQSAIEMHNVLVQELADLGFTPEQIEQMQIEWETEARETGGYE